MKKGEYSDLQIIEKLNKVINKVISINIKPKLTIYMFKAMGKELQNQLKVKSLSEKEIKNIVVNAYENPVVAPKSEAVPEPVKESYEDRLQKENISNSKINENGKEVISFSERGINNLHCGDNELFEEYGDTEITGHEDDGRVFKTSTVKRLSDGKIFSYSYIWHAEWPTDFWGNQIERDLNYTIPSS